MKRNLIQKLIEWKDTTERSPFLLTGRKGTGKTYLACDFAKSFYDNYIYINFETSPEMRRIFGGLNPGEGESLTDRLCAYYEMPAELLAAVPIILDEITFCPELIAALSAESCEMDFKGVFCLLLTSYRDELPEGLYEAFGAFCGELRGLEFDEFLIASGNEWYNDVIRGHYTAGKKIPEIVHNELLTLFEDYLIVGGMPAAVNEYLNMESTVNIPEQHRLLQGGCYAEIAGKYSDGDALKMRQVYETAAAQLLKENRKFQYRMIRKGATSTLYHTAIAALVGNGYLRTCPKMGDETQFKLYFPDVGMLHSQMALSVWEEENARKALLENYVLNSLENAGYHPCFWESASQAKIDFLIEKDGAMIPVEVRPGDNTRTKSIGVYKKQSDFPYSIKISSRNFEKGEEIEYIPYYAVFCL
ncbi:MAG: ATP-binding protein [Lachnospiraceae bacterium]|nr:ATP-binding protein [Lachnospiraceae bacterium]